jgi:capsular exopolysaccharide synthesis family protein
MTQDQKQYKPLLPETNGTSLRPLVPTYTAPFQDNHSGELNLRQLLTVVRRRAVVIESVVVITIAGVWFSTFTQAPQYEGKFRLLVESVTAEGNLAAGLSQPKDANVNANLKQSSLDYETQIQVLQSPKLMAPIITQLQTRYPDINYGSLIRNLRLVRFKDTKILEVYYQDANPQKIQWVLNQLSKGYLKYSLQERQTNLRQGNQFVEDQLPQLQQRVNSLQRELQQLRQQFNFINPENTAEELSTQISAIRQQRLDTQKQLVETKTFYQVLQGDSGEASVLNDAPIYQKLLSQLRDVESQIATELARFREDNPHIQTLREKRDNLLPLLRQEAGRVLNDKQAEVANQFTVLQVRAAAIAQAENTLNEQLKQLPALDRQYTDLQRELKVATDSLNRFLEKRESLEIEMAQKEIPWQLIAAPELPQVPISPNIPRNLILGVLGGILAGIGAAFLAERLDNRFHSPEELRDSTKLPLLGAIPFHKKLKTTSLVAEVVVSQNDVNLVSRNLSKERYESAFPFLEAFRSLHTNISFLSSDAPINSLVISSAVTTEGKSTVAVYLAQAAAAMGQRVLLVDADLRLPQIHTRLDLPNRQGLSNVISTNLPPIEAIQRSHLSDNLFVLTSGTNPPDPTKLLSSQKMRNIMEQLRQEFDLVIYDTPPLLGLADSSLLAPHTAGIILVARLNKTDPTVLRQALDGLKISRGSVLGLVVNGIKKYNFNAYNYYFSKR